jgi:magnesium transporter
VVACALYRDGQRVRDIPVEEIGASADHDGGIVWLGLHEPDGGCCARSRLSLDFTS